MSMERGFLSRFLTDRPNISSPNHPSLRHLETKDLVAGARKRISNPHSIG